MYENLAKDVENGLTFRQTIIGFAPAVCGQLNRKHELVPKKEILKELNRLKKELKRVEGLSEAQAELEHNAAYEKEMDERDQLIKNHTELRKKYTDLIDKIKAWDLTPYDDTLGHIRFVALRDLNFQMEQACYIPKASPVKYVGEEWKRNQIAALKLMIEDYAEHCKAEKEAVKHLHELLNREKDL